MVGGQDGDAALVLESSGQDGDAGSVVGGQDGDAALVLGSSGRGTGW